MAVTSSINLILTKLARAEIVGVNAHTLAIALDRAMHDEISFKTLSERQLAIVLLDRSRYPESPAEMNLFLSVSNTLSATSLPLDQIDDQHATQYMRWAAGFLNDPDPNVQKNVRVLVRWLVANRQAAIAADQTSLDNMRRTAEDPASVWRSSAYIVLALGTCGSMDDYDRVIFHAEKVIEHDRDNIEMVAEALYRLYPPALINAVQYFLDTTDPYSKQFTAGLHLVTKVAEIEELGFWRTYYEDMDKIIARLAEVAEDFPAVERIVDAMDKNLALASASADEEG